ncbi:MAG: ribosome biogenesis/translation initiation ATPase RLI [Candidatus Hadarchaeum sp.]|uniref:ribosome biogenesis/translation initiation ATPase RLI n=1 Tax=Candidatus Hadarchaeum sp. TaxID=2883567 RepID=UPI003D0ACBD3
MPRLAVIRQDFCQPKKCSLECHRYCPGVRTGDETIVIDEKTGRPEISEQLCTGCGICVHKCPLKAIYIINLPSQLEGRCVHRYLPNGFALFELPIPRAGSVTGLVGQNGVGKTTALQILAGRLRPNLGREAAALDEVIEFFKGSELQNHFKRIDKIKMIYKPQAVDDLPKAVKGKPLELLERIDERDVMKDLIRALELEDFLGRELRTLSGGEMQRLAIAAAAARDADIYFFDEPSSHLDVYQRLKAAMVIRSLAEAGKAVMVVEHDLAMLDYVSDYVHVLYGRPGVYGVVSSPRGVRVGINVFLDGYLHEENVMFRREPIKFELRPLSKARPSGKLLFSFPRMFKVFKGFRLEVSPGDVYSGEVIGIVGPNAVGKTTFVRILAGEVKPTSGKIDINLSVSHKPQYLKADFEGTVGEWLHKQLGGFDPSFGPDILQPLEVEPLLEREMKSLSGGELQRVSIAACLGRQADLYLLDEPSAYLDVEQRLNMSKCIRRTMERREAAAFVVDHDVLSIDYISDRLLVFTGEPSNQGHTHGPMEMREGMNLFLKEVGVTFRRDPQTGRPRANKFGSALDREQRAKGEYFYLH